jgi:hypothetical protein
MKTFSNSKEDDKHRRANFEALNYYVVTPTNRAILAHLWDKYNPEDSAHDTYWHFCNWAANNASFTGWMYKHGFLEFPYK